MEKKAPVTLNKAAKEQRERKKKGRMKERF